MLYQIMIILPHIFDENVYHLCILYQCDMLSISGEINFDDMT